MAHARADRRSRHIQPTVGEHEDLVAGLEAVQRNLVGVQQRLHLTGHGVEDRGRRGSLGDQRRHPPQRGLLLGQPLHLGARLGVGDRRGDQLGEAAQAATRCPPGAARPGVEWTARAPHRRPSTRIGLPTDGRDPELADQCRRWSRHVVPVVDAGRAARRSPPCVAGSPSCVGQRSGTCWVLARGGPGGDGADRVVGVVADHPGEIRAEQLADLLGDGGEQLARRHVLRDQRRHAPQRGLLVGEPLDLRARLGVGDGRGDQRRANCAMRVSVSGGSASALSLAARPSPPRPAHRPRSEQPTAERTPSSSADAAAIGAGGTRSSRGPAGPFAEHGRQ